VSTPDSAIEFNDGRQIRRVLGERNEHESGARREE
jgi:hypothetical protein